MAMNPAPGLAYIHRALNLPLTGTQLAQAYFSIGLANRTNGSETEARAALAKAIKADPKFMPAQLANMVLNVLQFQLCFVKVFDNLKPSLFSEFVWFSVRNEPFRTVRPLRGDSRPKHCTINPLSTRWY